MDLSNFSWQELLYVLIAAAVGYFLRRNQKPASDPTHVQSAATPEIHEFDFSDFTPLMRAAAAGDSKAVLVREAKALKAKPLQGRPVALMVQKMFKGLLEQFASNDKYKDWLIALLGTVLKIDLASLLKKVAPLLLFAILLCLAGTSYAAEPKAPQRFYSTAVELPAPQPLMWQQGQLVEYQSQPQQVTASQYVGAYGPDGSYSGPATHYITYRTGHQTNGYSHGYGPLRGGSWWTAGPARRFVSAPFRLIGRAVRRIRCR